MKKINVILTTLLIVFTISCKKSPEQFRYVTSNPHGGMWQETTLPLMHAEHQGILLIEIDMGKKLQTVDGFGACFNELGWDALNMLPDTSKSEIIETFFTEEGFNFNICRVPIGANDYARDWYSLNETEGDFEMVNFNIDRDRDNLVPYIKAAMEYNPDLKVWGSPWCPPSWMKHNKHYACTPAEVNDLSESGAGKEGETQFIMEENYLSAYALYFRKFVEAYKEEGINLYAVHVQNEPNSCQNFPSCVWTSGDQAEFIGEYLGPEFKENNTDAEIWYGTYERPHIENIDTIMNSKAGEYIAGIGFQWAGKKAIPEVNEKYPDMKLMQTESECGNGSNDWKAAEYTWSLIKHYFNNGANSYLYWNMILDETGKSQWGWKQNSLISVNSSTNQFTYNPEYYLFKHISHFVKPGAVMIETPAAYDDMLVFLNPGNELTGIILNNGFEPKAVQIKAGGKYIIIQLMPKSFNSFSVGV
jgi:glucosylceramidase